MWRSSKKETRMEEERKDAKLKAESEAKAKAEMNESPLPPRQSPLPPRWRRRCYQLLHKANPPSDQKRLYSFSATAGKEL
jgi:hypothetical protein